jgi:hypothetical protein
MLADHNKQLERELHDLDQMALAVQADCNSDLEKSTMKVSELQVRKRFPM